jgi:sporulation protein YlmC with PRC-barrel domain
MLISEITKKEVLDVNANKVGTLVDADVNVTQGTINYYVLRIGVRKTVPVIPDQVDRIGEKVLLKVSKETIEQAKAEVK